MQRRAAQPKETDVGKTLKLKTGIVNRNIKDLAFCKTENDRERARLETFEATNPDKVSQQRAVVEEARVMIPEYQNRIRKATEDLRSFLTENAEALSSEDYAALMVEAQTALTNATAAA